jgi:hypothetical protein
MRSQGDALLRASAEAFAILPISASTDCATAARK